MKFLFNIGTALFMMFAFAGNAQIKNTVTENLVVYGNCDRCKTAIENAGAIKNTASIVWNKDTHIAAVTYDKTKTNSDAMLKRIALAGYDSDKYLAPDDAYAALPECCQYTRTNKTAQPATPEKLHGEHTMQQQAKPLQPVYAAYFALKDALVASDSKAAATAASSLQKSISAIDMKQLDEQTHTVWMAVMKSLSTEAAKIEKATNIEQQRSAFMLLAEPMRKLVNVSTPGTVYYQHCPMANDGKGANWLSKESTIKNPYYGTQMLTCGKTVETIK